MDLLTFLNENGLEFNPIFDGTIYRYNGISRKSKSGWYIGNDINGNKYLLVGDWASSKDSIKWASKKINFKSESFKTFMDDSLRKSIEFKIENQSIAAIESAKHISRYSINIGIDNFKYCQKKKITSLYGASLCEDSFGIHLAVPMQDSSGDICSIQKIYEDGFKLFIKGAKKKGCYFIIPGNEDNIFICEGYATGVSIHESTGSMVIIAFDAGNIDSVISSLIHKYKNIIIAADNDQFNPTENIGLKRAQECKVKYGIEFKLPKFEDGLKDQRPTDFNDLFCLAGLTECKRQLLDDKKDDKFYSEEYLTFKNFFEMIYPTAKKCFLTEDITYPKGDGIRGQILNEIKPIRAQAMMAGLPKEKVEDYLEYWCQEMKESMLVDIPNWDGVDYIGDILQHIEVDNIRHDYFVELMKDWFAGIFCRIDNNHYQNKMVIWGGAQGLGKDTFIENMFKEFRPYFTSLNIGEKQSENDIFYSMSRHLVINIAEFDRTAKMHVSQLKNIITAAEATFRTPYSRKPETKVFRTSFIASCNPDDIFRDETGNRRFLFFKINSIDWSYQKGISLKILSQAKHLFLNRVVASENALESMKRTLLNMTPDSWESYAEEMWAGRLTALLNYRRDNGNYDNGFTYDEISLIIKEIAFSLSVSIRMVQSFIKKNYQIHNGEKRVYSLTKSLELPKISQITGYENQSVTKSVTL